MNLIFHDRSAASTVPGAATLTIERTGNFTFSAGAVAALSLKAGSPVVLAQDADTNAWFLVLALLHTDLKPFALRTAGAKNGGRLVFSSAHRATAYFKACAVAESMTKVRLHIGLNAMPYDGPGVLYMLQAEGEAAPATRDYSKGLPEACSRPYPVEAVDTSQVLVTQPEPLGGLEEWAQGVEPAPARHVQEWTTDHIKQLRQLYPTHTAAEIAVVLGRTAGSVKQKAYQLALEKQEKPLKTKLAKPPAPVAPRPVVPPAVPTAPAARPAPEKEISAGLENRLMKVVGKLGLKKLQSMEEHDAQQALKLLSDHRDVLAWVPGAPRLLTRLEGYFSMPVGAAMEGSRASA